MVFLCLRTILGLEPDLAHRRLRIDPVLPAWLDHIEVADLEAYDADIAFSVRRTARGTRVSGGGTRLHRVSDPVRS